GRCRYTDSTSCWCRGQPRSSCGSCSPGQCTPTGTACSDRRCLRPRTWLSTYTLEGECRSSSRDRARRLYDQVHRDRNWTSVSRIAQTISSNNCYCTRIGTSRKRSQQFRCNSNWRGLIWSDSTFHRVNCKPGATYCCYSRCMPCKNTTSGVRYCECLSEWNSLAVNTTECYCGGCNGNNRRCRLPYSECNRQVLRTTRP